MTLEGLRSSGVHTVRCEQSEVVMVSAYAPPVLAEAGTTPLEQMGVLRVVK